MRRILMASFALRSLFAAAIAFAAVPSCARGQDGEQPDRADAASSPQLPPDAARLVDATAPVDAEPACALPLVFDLDETGVALFDYDHPFCKGGPGFADGTLVFEDDFDNSETFFRAFPWDDQTWQLEELNYTGLECILISGSVTCDRAESGELVPIRLSSGDGQLDLEFRFDVEAQAITVETVTFTE